MISAFNGEYRWLSNFYPSPIRIGLIKYPTVEHAYQACKTLDEKIRIKIASLPFPGQAKQYGKKIELRSDWEEVKVEVMLSLLRLKFRHPHLRRKLIDTYPKKIEEGNYWGDTFWGVCKGKGQNVLGNLLMQVREEIRNDRNRY